MVSNNICLYICIFEPICHGFVQTTLKSQTGTNDLHVDKNIFGGLRGDINEWSILQHEFDLIFDTMFYEQSWKHGNGCIEIANRKIRKGVLETNIDINNDIINSKNSVAMNKNGTNQSCGEITTNDKTKQFSKSYLNVTPNAPVRIQSNPHQSQHRYEEQHEYSPSPKKDTQ